MVCVAKTVTSYKFKPRKLAIGNCSETLIDSAIAAEMFVRKNQNALKLSIDKDTHLLVHIFPSETHKSGYSAGCAIATSMISAIKGIPVPL
uniref:Lon proteolytic domain-containing protein n=1 Tax=Meloidogyne javanica TaxID=6303 RepID=A0A915M2H5_MELJA